MFKGYELCCGCERLCMRSEGRGKWEVIHSEVMAHEIIWTMEAILRIVGHAKWAKGGGKGKLVAVCQKKEASDHNWPFCLMPCLSKPENRRFVCVLWYLPHFYALPLSSLSVHSTYPIYSVLLPFAAPPQSHNSYRSQKDWKHASPIIMSFLSVMSWVKWTVSKITSPSYFSSCEIET